MLITPASTALLLSDNLKKVIVLSGIIGAITGFIGMSLAIVLDAPPGPELVVVVSFLFFLAAMFAPKKGYVYRSLQKRKLQKKIQQEDILKQAYRLEEKRLVTKEKLMSRLAFNASLLNKHLNKLKIKGLIENKNQKIRLTEEGRKEANRLIRAHRLWETYMVQQMGMTEEQIHEEAERYEHLLTDDIIEEVDEKLGYPTIDPHGSRIPTRKDHPDFPLSHLAPKSLAQIDEEQINQSVIDELRKLGLLPETNIEVLERTPNFIEVNLNGVTVKVPVKLAREINIKVP